MVNGRPVSRELDAWFNSLMVSSSSQMGQAESGGGPLPTLSGWKDLPVELLLRIISTVGDDRMIIVASGVCTGWRDALGWGVTRLSLSWWACFYPGVLNFDQCHFFTISQFWTVNWICPDDWKDCVLVVGLQNVKYDFVTFLLNVSKYVELRFHVIILLLSNHVFCNWKLTNYVC